MSKTFIHKNLVEAVARALHLTFSEKKYADRVIERLLKENPRWGSRDRRFIAETTYEIVRRWRFILFCGELQQEDENVFLKAIRVWFILQKIDLTDWMKEGLDANKIEENKTKAETIRAVRESIPDWLDECGERELGNRWEKELHALNEQAQVVVRVNTLKTSRGDLEKVLALAEVETFTLPFLPDAIVLKKRTNLFQLEAFKEGWFELQDASSQQVGMFLDVQPGMRVIDACAGGGGKTLHLAALMQNKGHIIALDTEGWKLQELRKRSRRAGAGIVETRTIDSTKVIKRLYDSADRVLLDVPCSGLGVLRRNPDAKWKLDLEYIERVKKLQADILSRYSKMVKPGGKLVYATCSILNSENQEQVKTFLEQNKDSFELEEEKQIFPSEGFDGFYIARVIRIK